MNRLNQSRFIWNNISDIVEENRSEGCTIYPQLDLIRQRRN